MAYFLESDSGIAEITELEWSEHTGSKYGKGRDRYVTEGVAEAEHQAVIDSINSTKTANDVAAAALAAKQSMFDSVAAITVEVNGKVFDGDETSQTRMARAVSVSDIGETTVWKLADNTWATVTAEELKEALRLSGFEQTRIMQGGV